MIAGVVDLPCQNPYCESERCPKLSKCKRVVCASRILKPEKRLGQFRWVDNFQDGTGRLSYTQESPWIPSESQKNNLLHTFTRNDGKGFTNICIVF